MARTTKAYGLSNPLQDVFPVPIQSQRSPTTSDVGYQPGQVWINLLGGSIWMLVSVQGGLADWESVSTISGVIPPSQGGTGVTTIPSNSQLLIGNSATGAYTVGNITSSGSIVFTPGSGTLAVDSAYAWQATPLPFTMAANASYIINPAGAIAVTMPSIASSTIGSEINLLFPQGFVNPVTVQLNAQQIINGVAGSSTVGGTMTSTQPHSSVTLVCTGGVAPQNWDMTNIVGIFTLA